MQREVSWRLDHETNYFYRFYLACTRLVRLHRSRALDVIHMTLVPGTRLGRYEIRFHIGTGGMGEIYQATDSELHRIVALKILPAAFVSDAGRLRRFIQEARAASALN